MKKDCLKWICELAEIKPDDARGCDHGWVGVLIKAMWAINRKFHWSIDIDNVGVKVWLAKKKELNNKSWDLKKEFDYQHCNHSEQKALQAALEDIHKNKNK